MALQYSDVVTAQQGKTPDQVAADAQAATLPNTISSAQLKPTPPVSIPTSTPDATQADGVVAGATAGMQSTNDFLASITPAPTALDSQYQDLLNGYAQLQGQDTGKPQALAQAKIDAGAPDFQKQLTDLNGQITVGNAAYAQMQAKEQSALAGAEANSRSSFDYTGSSGAIQRQALAERATKAAEIGMLAARAQAVSGNLQTAMTIASNAVDAKYAPIEDALKVKQAQLQAIQPLLDKQEKQQATRQQVLINDRSQQLANEKQKEKDIQNIMVEAAKSGASPDTLKNIQESASVEQAISIGGYDLGASFRQQVAQQKFDNTLKSKQLSLDQAKVGIERDRLALDNAKEAFTEAQKLNPQGQPSPVMQQSVSKANIDLVGSLATDKALSSVVGPNPFTRQTNFFSKYVGTTNFNAVNGANSNFIAGVEQVRSQLNLDALIKAKSEGATFGALSDQELQVLASTATKIGTWALKDGSGNVIGYNATEGDFKKELDKISNFAKLDYVLKGGNPADVNIKQEPDGTFTTVNSDGSITNLGN